MPLVLMWCIFCLVLFSCMGCAESSQIDGSKYGSSTALPVVSHVVCAIPNDCLSTERKATYLEMSTYAQMKEDPKASLGSSFTICSTVGSPIPGAQIFFSLLGQNGDQFLSVWLINFFQAYPSVGLAVGDEEFSHPDQTFPVFPFQWVRSCLAVDTESGKVILVVDGQVVQERQVEALKNSANSPKDLSGKILLGTHKYSKIWLTRSNKVTNLNIFSSLMSIERMVRMATGGEEECGEEGDYLAWRDTQWTLLGDAVAEEVERGEACQNYPSSMKVLYHAGLLSFPACVKECEDLGGRLPLNLTIPEYLFLKSEQNELKCEVWLATTDEEEEGVWRDYYTGYEVPEPPWKIDQPNGGRVENCLLQISENSVKDTSCNWHRVCACELSKKKSYFELRGFPSSSHYIPYEEPSKSMSFIAYDGNYPIEHDGVL